jgi:beta-phosphoglucomutase
LEATLQAVIFDLDGVITDTARYHYLAWKKIADEIGVYFDEQINERLKGVDRMRSLEIILERVLRKFSESEKRIWAERKNEYYQELISAMTPQELAPGTGELLAALKEMDIKTGLASVSKNAGTVIEKLQIKDFFDYMADAARIKKSKPDPEIFLTVADQLQVQASCCIGVEDAAAGIAAIKAAGMYAVGIGNSRILSEADEVISGLEEFNLQKHLRIEDRGRDKGKSQISPNYSVNRERISGSE